MLADTRVAVRQAGEATDQIAQLAGTTNAEMKPIAADLRKTVASAQRSMDALEGAVNDARPGLKAFSTQTIPSPANWCAT